MERLMQYVWQHRLWDSRCMRTTAGEVVDVLDPGLLNTGAGPDFFNAKVRIGRKVWAGNVEIHVKASDWHRHGHSFDPAYNSIVLHVVETDDCDISRPDGHVIPQLKMTWSREIAQRYSALINSPIDEPACADSLRTVPSLYINDWINALAFERLQARACHIRELVENSAGDWLRAIYITLARALGFGFNAEPLERVAMSLPLKVLLKHADSLITVEALLFGMAGLLEVETFPKDWQLDSYTERMIADYRFMRSKFNLEPPRNLGWKLGRMRPQNLPHRRLAQLAAYIHDGFKVGNLSAIENVEAVKAAFSVPLRGYWAANYRFGTPAQSADKEVSLGRDSINRLIANVAIPFLYAYGSAYGHSSYIDLSIELLQQLPPESNRIVRLFRSAGLECTNAFTSQALIQLRRAYCEPRKCLYCRLGHRILSTAKHP